MIDDPMRIVLIADVFPPLRSSGAVQLRDLSAELARQGHQVTVLTPAPTQIEAWTVEAWSGVRVVRLRSPKTKDTNYLRRTIGELLMPFVMLRNLRKSPVASERYDGVVWYSPTIFLGPMAKALKRKSVCKGYLIIRDIFPEWAVDMGLMGKGLPYLFFKSITNFQYSVADAIGVQATGNLTYFHKWTRSETRRVEVLQNWLSEASVSYCSIDIEATPLAGRKIFVYAGNMGVAQGLDILLDLAERMMHRVDVGFLFVGRGKDVHRLKADAVFKGLDNVLFHDEIDPSEIAGLYAQCQVGLIALDSRHRTHNIPGKFLTYMQSGLPVLANVNIGNDLVHMIRAENVGKVSEDNSIDALQRLTEEFLAELETNAGYAGRCRDLFKKQFTAEAAARQILRFFSKE